MNAKSQFVEVTRSAQEEQIAAAGSLLTSRRKLFFLHSPTGRSEMKRSGIELVLRICGRAKSQFVEATVRHKNMMPLLCELDNVMITLQHGVLHREQTIAEGGEYCDYWIVGNRETQNG